MANEHGPKGQWLENISLIRYESRTKALHLRERESTSKALQTVAGQGIAWHGRAREGKGGRASVDIRKGIPLFARWLNYSAAQYNMVRSTVRTIKLARGAWPSSSFPSPSTPDWASTVVAGLGLSWRSPLPKSFPLYLLYLTRPRTTGDFLLVFYFSHFKLLSSSLLPAKIRSTYLPYLRRLPYSSYTAQLLRSHFIFLSSKVLVLDHSIS